MASILILGGGFGGLTVAERLAAALGKEHEVTLVSPNRKFTFYPALVQLAFGGCEPEEIAFDLTDRAKLLDFRFIQGEAVDADTQNKQVKITGDDFNGEIAYDYLVIAVGRRLATEKIAGFFEHSHHLLGVKAALKFRQAIANFEKGRIVVGLCPGARLPVPVCETAFGFARLFKKEMRENTVSIQIVFPETIQKAFGGAEIHRQLLSAFEKHGIEAVTDFPVREVSKEAVISESGEEIIYDLPMLVPPFRGQTFVHNITTGEENRAADDLGFALVNDKMRVSGLERVYAVGDIVAFSGPKLAHMAIRQAVVASENILSEIKGKEPKKAYYHEIATIIDQGGAESMYLHYGIWDDVLYQLKEGRFWSWAKEIHDGFWVSSHS